jgi:cell division protein FtsB
VNRRRLLGLGALLGLCGTLAAYGGSATLRVWQLRREIDTMERELAALRVQTDRLTEAVERFRNDPGYVEKLAREDLGMVRPGETVLKFPTEKR